MNAEVGRRTARRVHALPCGGACGLWIRWQHVCDTYASPLPRTLYTRGAFFRAPRGGPTLRPREAAKPELLWWTRSRDTGGQLLASALEEMGCNRTLGWPWRNRAEACLELSGPAALRAGCASPQNPQTN